MSPENNAVETITETDYESRLEIVEAELLALRAEITYFKEMFDKGVKSLLSNPMARMALKQFGVDPESFNADNLRH